MEQYFCTECGCQLEPGERFCPECGNPIETAALVAAAAVPPPLVPKKRNRKTLIWFLVSLLLLVCIGAGVTIGVLLQEEHSTPCRLEEDEEDSVWEDSSPGAESHTSSLQAPPAEPSNTPSSEPSAPPREDLPEDWSDHLYLHYKDKGYCESLTGNVLVTFVFVSDPQTIWDADLLTQTQDILYDELVSLYETAQGYDVDLALSYLYLETSVSIETGYDNDYLWSEQAMESLGYDSVDDAQLSLEQEHGVNAAPLVFVLPKNGRAYAYPTEYALESEYVVLFEHELEALQHELFHLFGAEDYYYPDDTEVAAKIYLTDSVMLGSIGVLDDFTAYCIGWTENLSRNAISFLKATSHITIDDMNAALDEENFTGVGRIDYGSGAYYEGDIVMGTPHGTGTYVFANGDVYRGEFDSGYFHGYGVFTFADGDSYEGDFVYNQFHGNGTYRYEDGTVYTGGFVEDSFCGYGTLTFPDGEYYVGQFQNDDFHGKGSYHFNDGEVWSGMWENGAFLGQ